MSFDLFISFATIILCVYYYHAMFMFTIIICLCVYHFISVRALAAIRTPQPGAAEASASGQPGCQEGRSCRGQALPRNFTSPLPGVLLIMSRGSLFKTACALGRLGLKR